MRLSRAPYEMDLPVRRNATTVKTGTVKPTRGGTRPREIWFLRSEAQSPRQGSAPRAEARLNLLTRQATFPGGDRRFFSLYRGGRPFSVVLSTPGGGAALDFAQGTHVRRRQKWAESRLRISTGRDCVETGGKRVAALRTVVISLVPSSVIVKHI